MASRRDAPPQAHRRGDGQREMDRINLLLASALKKLGSWSRSVRLDDADTCAYILAVEEEMVCLRLRVLGLDSR